MKAKASITATAKASAKAAPGRPSAYRRDDIVDCALHMLVRDGIEGMTLRGVARELGCVLGTINYHFDNLADLEDAVVARLMERIPVLDAASRVPLREQLVEIGLAYARVHSMHPYVRQVAGPMSIEIAARQLRQDWATLQALGLPEQAAMLCMELVSALAHNRGTEMHRMRHGGETALRLSEEFMGKAGMAPPTRLTAADFTVESMEPYLRTLFGAAIDAFLAGLGAQQKPAKRGKARKTS